VVSAAFADRLRVLGHIRRFSPGTTIVHAADHSTSVHLLTAGRAKVVRFTRDGNEVFIEHREAGELVGELGVLAGQPRSASVIAEGAVQTVEVDAARFVEELRGDPSASLPLLVELANLLHESASTRAVLRSGDVAARIATRLVQLAGGGHGPDACPVRIDIRHDDLAAWAAVNRETVTRALGRLRAEDLLRTGRGWVEVLDLRRLAERAVE